MAGFPDETEEDLRLSIKAMKELASDYVIWSILTPYPGTEVWKIAEDRGLISIADCDWKNFFHHYNRGNLFKTIGEPIWNNLINEIHWEEKIINNRLTWLKFKKKIKNKLYLINLGLKNPSKIINFFLKKICPRKQPS